LTEPISLRVGRVAAPLREQVLEVLRRAIVEQHLPPGHRLIERELIEQTGVSRTTIREVLRELAAEGLVTTVPQKGAVVAVPSAEEAAELYEVRAALEGLAARRFVERAGPERVDELRAAFRELEEVTEGGDVRAMLRAKDRFYDVLLCGCGNGAVQTILSSLKARVGVLRTASMSQPGRPKHALAEIRAIVEAVEARDAEAAAAACARHVEQAAKAGLPGLKS
jgi:GntR family transcriptional regulator, trigonelline degradation regulator